MDRNPSALIFDIKRDCSEDGSGIRTTVFFKGCPLSCIWCQNPEGMAREASISFRRELCHPQRCGAPCAAVCPSDCLRLGPVEAADMSRRPPGAEPRFRGSRLENLLRVLSRSPARIFPRTSRNRSGSPLSASEPDRTYGLDVRPDLCTGCGRCFDRCPDRLLEPVGYRIELEELLYRILIDKPFFSSTGGGVTVSGGEPTLQMAFLEAFLKRLKGEGISTAIETGGFFNFGAFSRRLLPWLDCIYYDLKLIDEAEHRRYTGRSNRPILANLERIADQTRVPIHVRIPLIPGVTTNERNLSGIARFLRAHGIKKANVIPYNPLWQDKLERLGLKCRYGHRSFMTQPEQAACIAFLSPD